MHWKYLKIELLIYTILFLIVGGALYSKAPEMVLYGGIFIAIRLVIGLIVHMIK
jgi:hypothetical protein